MPHVYAQVRSLIGLPEQGKRNRDGSKGEEGNCVQLIKMYAPGLKGLSTLNWAEGVKVIGSKGLQPGTAIATFVNGRYPRKNSGNHAAFFLAYAGASFWVVDQWPASGEVKRRIMSHRNPMPDGTYADPSNSAGAFSVIELRSCAPSCS